MMQPLAGAGPGQGQLLPGESWSRPRLWPNSCAMEEATPRMLVEWSWQQEGTLQVRPSLPPVPSSLITWHWELIRAPWASEGALPASAQELGREQERGKQLTMLTPPEKSGEQMEFWTAMPTRGPENKVAL